MQTDSSRTTSWWRTFEQLTRHAAPYERQLRACLVGLAVAAVFQGLALSSLFPLLHALLDRHDWTQAMAWLVTSAVLMLAMTVMRWRVLGFDYDGRMTSVTHFLRLRLGEKLRAMPLEQLQRRRTGEINATLLSNVDEQLHFTLSIVDLLCMSLLTPVTVAMTCLLIDWRIGALLLLSFPTVFFLHRRLRPLHHRTMRQLNEANRDSGANVLDYVQGMPDLRAARVDGERARGVQAGFARLESLQRASHREAAKPGLVAAALMEMSLLAVAAICAAWVWQGDMPVGWLAAVLVVMARFAEPMSLLVTYTIVFELIGAALERIEEIMHIQPLPEIVGMPSPGDSSGGSSGDASGNSSGNTAPMDVRFEAVSFRYDGAGTAALEGVDVVIPARGMTALVGPSGAGKSSVLRLLMRHADPQQGRVLIGGDDIRTLSAGALNARVAAVFQDVYLFDDTVAGNIRMGRPDATDDELREAARAAQCLDFIEQLPQGWATPLGEMGSRLSGGQRQRISIARALLKNAPVVVLDEPTAALDVDSELAVQRAINALVQDKTVIVVAHRLSTIVGADQILVIDGGKVVQRGRHDELLHREGRYRAMWQAREQAGEWRA